MYQNARGHKSKTIEFFNNILAIYQDFIFISETRLSDYIRNSELFGNNFEYYRRDIEVESSGLCGGGGVLVAVRNNFRSRGIDEFNNHRFMDIDFVAICVNLLKKILNVL